MKYRGEKNKLVLIDSITVSCAYLMWRGMFHTVFISYSGERCKTGIMHQTYRLVCTEDGTAVMLPGHELEDCD